MTPAEAYQAYVQARQDHTAAITAVLALGEGARAHCQEDVELVRCVSVHQGRLVITVRDPKEPRTNTVEGSRYFVAVNRMQDARVDYEQAALRHLMDVANTLPLTPKTLALYW